MTIHVSSQDVESSINAAVRSGQFASADEMIANLVREYAERTPSPPAVAQAEPSEEPLSASHKPMWEEILELTAGIPDAEFEKLPTDGAEQHDHYLYGTPKRPVAP